MSDPLYLEKSVFNALSAITGIGAVYAQVAPDQTSAPFAVYTRVATNPEKTLASGIVIRNARVQVDVYSKTYSEALTLADSVETAVLAIASPITAHPLGAVDTFEPDVRLHRVMQEFSIWHY